MPKTTGHTKAAAKTSRPITTNAKPIPIADFDDTIAHNRALEILDVDSIPRLPTGYRATDPHVRNRRLRKLASELRAEAVLALDEAANRDLREDLGKYAPDPMQAAPMRQRLAQAGRLRAAARVLFNYACEIDQIALSDALRFLEVEHKQFAHAVEHEPALAERYPALTTLFQSRAGAIAEGIAKAKDDTDADGEGDDHTDAEASDA
jgi:hypothetical protein